MGEIEFGKCNFCKEEKTLSRKYYYYDVKCSCCSGDKHFEIVWHCLGCEPKPSIMTTIQIEPNENNSDLNDCNCNSEHVCGLCFKTKGYDIKDGKLIKNKLNK